MTLTLDEKFALLVGDGLWHTNSCGGKLPALKMSDGPHGLRTVPEGEEHALKATAFPTLSCLASTWNRELAKRMGELIAEEAIERDVDILLAPGVNLKRTPLNGRNFEYLSEDPFLAGELAKCYIEGVQSRGVGASLKHFAVNSREYDRFYTSSEADERTLHEFYLSPFRRALEAKPWTVMCSYNLLNGVYCSEHRKLLHDILREEFGFGGVILSDWGAVVDRAKSLKATLDLEMPENPASVQVLKEAYERGYLTEEEIDESVGRILALLDTVKRTRGLRKITHSKEERHRAAVGIAAEGAVLLRRGSLPIRGGKVLVLGRKAKTGVIGGGGSSRVDTVYVQEDLSSLLQKEEPAIRAELYEACFGDGSLNGFFGLREAIALAEEADSVVVVVGCDEKTDAEGTDRMSLRLTPAEEDFLLKITAANPRTAVVVYGGSAVDMRAWFSCADSVLYTNFNGEGGNEALAKLLTGRINPSGRLQESFPVSAEYALKSASHDVCREGVFVGYRDETREFSFPFGYGLSYSEFAYSDLRIEREGNCFRVRVCVENVSDTAGAEVVQLYVGQRHPLVSRPPLELKGFEKLFLGAGEKGKAEFLLSEEDFAYFSPALGTWRTEDGSYTVMIGRSARDIVLKETVRIVLDADRQPSQRNCKARWTR